MGGAVARRALDPVHRGGRAEAGRRLPPGTTYALYHVADTLELMRRNLVRDAQCRGRRTLGNTPDVLKLWPTFAGRVSSLARLRWQPHSGSDDRLPVLCVETKKNPVPEGAHIRRPATREELHEDDGKEEDEEQEKSDQKGQGAATRDYTTTYATEYVPFAAKTCVRQLFGERRTLLPDVVSLVCAYMDHLGALWRVASPWIHSLRECAECRRPHEMFEMERCMRCGRHVCADECRQIRGRGMCGFCGDDTKAEAERRRRRDQEEREGQMPKKKKTTTTMNARQTLDPMV